MRKKSQTDRTAARKIPGKNSHPSPRSRGNPQLRADRINAEPKIDFKAVAVEQRFQGPYSGLRFHASSDHESDPRLGCCHDRRGLQKTNAPEGMKNQLPRVHLPDRKFDCRRQAQRQILRRSASNARTHQRKEGGNAIRSFRILHARRAADTAKFSAISRSRCRARR